MKFLFKIKMPQCSALTSKSELCSRTGKYGNYCKQHFDLLKKTETENKKIVGEVASFLLDTHEVLEKQDIEKIFIYFVEKINVLNLEGTLAHFQGIGDELIGLQFCLNDNKPLIKKSYEKIKQIYNIDDFEVGRNGPSQIVYENDDYDITIEYDDGSECESAYIAFYLTNKKIVDKYREKEIQEYVKIYAPDRINENALF